MNDFFGKEIKAGDTVELRADGHDGGSAFRRGIVLLDANRKLAIKTKCGVTLGGHTEYWTMPLGYLEMSNDIVKVESE